MTAPVPSESTTPGPSLEQQAANIYANYVWIARFIVEMNNDVQLDMKKAAQLVRINGPMFVTATQSAGPLLRDAFMKRLEAQGVSWPNIATELPGIVTALNDFFNFVQTNFPAVYTEANTIGEVFITDSGFLSDRPVLVTKPPALATEIAGLRALFS